MNGSALPQKAASTGMLIAIFAVYFAVPDMGYITPALSNIAQVCNVDPATASYLYSSVAISQTLSAALCGFIAGRKVRYKTLLLIAHIGIAIFGTMPAYMPSTTPFWIFIVIRVIFGLFLGLLMPVVNASIASAFSDKQKRASVFGLGNLFFNGGAVFGLLAGGFLATVAWNASFWLYGINAIIAVIVEIAYKEPGIYREEAKREKVRIPVVAWFYTAVFALANMGFSAMNMMLASVMDTHSLGDAASTGVFLAIAVGVGALVSLLFGLIFKALKKWTLVFGAVVAAAGYFLVYVTGNAQTLFFFAVAVAIVGFGHTVLTVGTPQFTGLSVSPAAYAAAMSIAAVFWQLGSFLSSPFTQIVSAVFNTNDYIVIFPVLGVLLAGLTVLYAVAAKRSQLHAPDLKESAA